MGPWGGWITTQVGLEACNACTAIAALCCIMRGAVAALMVDVCRIMHAVGRGAPGMVPTSRAVCFASAGRMESSYYAMHTAVNCTTTGVKVCRVHCGARCDVHQGVLTRHLLELHGRCPCRTLPSCFCMTPSGRWRPRLLARYLMQRQRWRWNTWAPCQGPLAI